MGGQVQVQATLSMNAAVEAAAEDEARNFKNRYGGSADVLPCKLPSAYPTTRCKWALWLERKKKRDNKRARSVRPKQQGVWRLLRGEELLKALDQERTRRQATMRVRFNGDRHDTTITYDLDHPSSVWDSLPAS